eukprot:TRINITY_DN17277_c0_g1_i1.p1 TRINITY_DN17277_c0_g1~~TRINITY_DN17277_c0_g1_i1.p1  ORF type:complete len:1165 (+),score=235.74 TRINITY_DN17277_c0_g1_i1:170-3664(+)
MHSRSAPHDVHAAAPPLVSRLFAFTRHSHPTWWVPMALLAWVILPFRICGQYMALEVAAHDGAAWWELRVRQYHWVPYAVYISLLVYPAAFAASPADQGEGAVLACVYVVLVMLMLLSIVVAKRAEITKPGVGHVPHPPHGPAAFRLLAWPVAVLAVELLQFAALGLCVVPGAGAQAAVLGGVGSDAAAALVAIVIVGQAGFGLLAALWSATAPQPQGFEAPAARLFAEDTASTCVDRLLAGVAGAAARAMDVYDLLFVTTTGAFVVFLNRRFEAGERAGLFVVLFMFGYHLVASVLLLPLLRVDRWVAHQGGWGAVMGHPAAPAPPVLPPLFAAFERAGKALVVALAVLCNFHAAAVLPPLLLLAIGGLGTLRRVNVAFPYPYRGPWSDPWLNPLLWGWYGCLAWVGMAGCVVVVFDMTQFYQAVLLVLAGWAWVGAAVAWGLCNYSHAVNSHAVAVSCSIVPEGREVPLEGVVSGFCADDNVVLSPGAVLARPMPTPLPFVPAAAHPGAVASPPAGPKSPAHKTPPAPPPNTVPVSPARSSAPAQDAADPMSPTPTPPPTHPSPSPPSLPTGSPPPSTSYRDRDSYRAQATVASVPPPSIAGADAVPSEGEGLAPQDLGVLTIAELVPDENGYGTARSSPSPAAVGVPRTTDSSGKQSPAQVAGAKPKAAGSPLPLSLTPTVHPQHASENISPKPPAITEVRSPSPPQRTPEMGSMPAPSQPTSPVNPLDYVHADTTADTSAFVEQAPEDAMCWNANAEEDERDYCPGGYHRVTLGDVYDGRYEVLTKLGWGQFSTVWLAHDRVDGVAVALKISKAAEDFARASEYEISILKEVNTAAAAEFSTRVAKLTRSFVLTGPHGVHTVMVLEVCGPSLLKLVGNHNYRGIPANIVKVIARQTLEALAYLHDVVQVVHTDVKPENILLTCVDPGVLEAAAAKGVAVLPEVLQEHADILHGVCRIRDGESLFGALTRCFSIKVSDLGAGRWRSKRYPVGVIQTREYRCPEVILGYPVITPAADVWSCACVIFELLTGDYMFDPKNQDVLDKDVFHLGLFMQLLGDIPHHVATANGAFVANFFDSAGAFRHPQLRPVSLEDILVHNYAFPHDEAALFVSFLRPMLVYDPAKRASAREALEHPWLTAGLGDAGARDTAGQARSSEPPRHM